MGIGYAKGCDERQSVLHVAIKEYLDIEHLDPEGKSKAFNKFEVLLRSGKCDVNTLNLQKQTILHMICSKHPRDYSSKDDKFSLLDKYEECDRDKRLLEFLLEQSFDVNGRDIDGKTALMLACENQNFKVLSQMLNLSKEKGIRLDLDAVDSAGETALSGAFKRRDRCIAEVLFEARLSAAIEDAEEDIVKSLLDNLVYGNETDASLIVNRHSASRIHNEMNLPYRPSALFVINLDFWTEAIIEANTKSEVILSLLLDYGVNAYRQDCEYSNSLLHLLVHPQEIESKDYVTQIQQLRKYFCAAEILLKSGKVNVNTVNSEGRTPLHTIFVKNLCLLLLRHGANVTAKDKSGNTVLAIPSAIGCNSIIRSILDWAKEKNIRLDLDAKDLAGTTALINAAKWKNTSAVEMLLEAGASVNASDNRGFTALHYALFEIPNPFLWAIFRTVARGYIELGERKEIIDALFNSQIPHECYDKDRKELNAEKMLTVDLFLRRSELDVNALDYEGFSPLDIAELSIAEVPSSTIDLLKQKGAKLSVFQSKYLQPFNNLDFLSRNFDDCLRQLFYFQQPQTNELLAELSQVTRELLVSPRDEKLRTPLHHVIISLANKFVSDPVCDSIKTLISFGCNVNATDIYGRTPLHYAETIEFASILLRHGADKTITDNDGISAVNMTKMLQEMNSKSYKKTSFMHDFFKPYLDKIKNEFQLSSTHSYKYLDHINPLTIAERVWESGEYAFRHPMINEVTNEVLNFMESLASEIKKMDPIFEVKPVFVGSGNEGTKINYPDEFDFDFVLTKFSQLCTVSQSPELPTGFCHLKRKDGTKEDGFESFFDVDGILITERVNTRFKILLTNVLTDDCFIKSHLNFDWSKCPFEIVKSNVHIVASLVATLKLTKMKLNPNDQSTFREISIDIVPCIHIDGWWPDEAISNVCEEIKAIGCNLVFDRPQRLFPWVPFSRSCVRISFAPAESEMIKQSSDEVKKAYMIGKQMLEYTINRDRRWNTSYVFKNSLLYCIEAFESTSEIDFHLWLECLMKCHYEHVFQDFCPCYFMLTCTIPIERERKSFYPKCLSFNDEAFVNNHFVCYALHRITSLQASPPSGSLIESYLNFKMPLLNPIIERFDRRNLITDLTKLARNDREPSYMAAVFNLFRSWDPFANWWRACEPPSNA